MIWRFYLPIYGSNTLALDAGMSERDIAASTGHADSRMVSYYDRNRDSIARNTTHAVAAWVAGAL